MTAPAVLPPLPMEYAVALHYGGMPVDDVAVKTGQSVSGIAAAIKRAELWLPTPRAAIVPPRPSTPR